MSSEPQAMAPYRRIATQIMRQITSGELRPGDHVPSVNKIMEVEKVSRATATRVAAVLREEGYAKSVPGVGTVVVAPRKMTAGGARLGRLARTGQPYAEEETSTDHTAALQSCADPAIADLLGVELHDEIVMRTRVFLRGGERCISAISLIHSRAIGPVPEVLETGPSPRFWQDLYRERTGRAITRSPERLGARLASNSELAALNIEAPPTQPIPLLVVQNTFHDDVGPIEVWEDVYAPGMWQVPTE